MAARRGGTAWRVLKLIFSLYISGVQNIAKTYSKNCIRIGKIGTHMHNAIQVASAYSILLA